MANRAFYDVALQDYAPKGYESLSGVVSGSTLAMIKALQGVTNSDQILGKNSSNKDLTDEEKISRTLELKFTLDQIVQVKKELTQERQDLPSSDKDTLLTQKLLLQHLDDGLTNALDTTSFSLNVMGQRGMALGVGNFVAENAKAIGLLLYDTSILTEALDNDTRARNSARVEGISYLLTHWDELPDQVVNQLKKDITEASKKFDAGDYEGGGKILGQLEANLYSTVTGVGGVAVAGLKLTVKAAEAIGKLGVKSERLLWGNWNDYPKVTQTGPNGPQEYAKIGDRLYSQHAVARMQPSGQRYSSGAPAEGQTQPITGDRLPYVNEPGINYSDGTKNIRGRSISPNHVGSGLID